MKVRARSCNSGFSLALAPLLRSRVRYHTLSARGPPGIVTYRLFNCARCHVLVQLCRRCDRGNRYCGRVCSGEARRESLRRAKRRYEASERAKLLHAARQQFYLIRRAAKMTHHGSAVVAAESPSASPSTTQVEASETHHATPPRRPIPATTPSRRCSLCNRPIGDVARRHFLHATRGPPGR